MRRKFQIYSVLVAIIVLTGAWRIVGLSWDNYAATHPDERFVATITGAIGSKDNLLPEVVERCQDDPHADNFFNTRCSHFNPVNVNSGAFAYGTLPVFIVWKTADILTDITGDRIWASSTAVPLVGRSLNILAEMLAVLIIFLIGRRLFGEIQGLVAAMLYAGAALPIQLAHFWAVDTISHLFFILTFYFAVIISQTNRTWAYLAFGLAFGAAVASRANLAVAAILAPLAAVIYISQSLDTHADKDKHPLRRQVLLIILQLLGAAFVAFWVFRLAQPYAFDGPTLFNVIDRINLSPPFIHLNWSEKWRYDLDEVANLASNRADGWPPSHQWVGRIPYLYPWLNWLWGMGIFLWLAGTIALGLAFYRQAIKRQLSAQVGLLSIWFLLYFGWQGQLHFMTLRYYLPLYAVLALLAAWWTGNFDPRWRKVARGVLVAGTFFWAFAFTAIYRHPQTRVEAAYWMRDNIPATINGRLPDGSWIPLGLAYDAERGPAYDLLTLYHPRLDVGRVQSRSLRLAEADSVEQIWFRWIENVNSVSISLQLRELIEGNESAEGVLIQEFTAFGNEGNEITLDIPPDARVNLNEGMYRWELSVNWAGTENAIHFMVGANPALQWLDAVTDDLMPQTVPIDTYYDQVRYYTPTRQNSPLGLEISEPTTLTQLYLVHQFGPRTDLSIQLGDDVYTARYIRNEPSDSLLGEGRYYQFERPITLPNGISYLSSAEPFWFTGTAIVSDGDWEDATPARICWDEKGQAYSGYIPFRECNFFGAYDRNWYTDARMQVVVYDSEQKYRFMQDVLLKADYIAISSNRMYDALPRNESLYWYTSQYYDALFDGSLGFEQVARFASFPRLGFLVFPDQLLPDSAWPDWLNAFESEEAFSVYDHPTSYILKKTDYTPAKLPVFSRYIDERNRLDLAEIPASVYTAPADSPSDASMWRIVALWAIGWLLLGWLSFPLIYPLLPSLPLRGFMLTRPLAWLILAIVPWWITAASGLPFWRREALAVFLIAFITLNLFLAWRNRHSLGTYIRQHWRMMLFLDALWVLAFGFAILLRGVNPDFWHTYFGGEKHMDLAYLHAIIRTESFPPPSPWMSGFSLNYYYLGFVILAAPLKLFAIAPEYAPNLMLATLYPTLFVMVLGLLWSLLSLWKSHPTTADLPRERNWRLLFVIVGVSFIMLAGSYGTLQRMIKPEADMAAHRWYWYPTRIIAETQVTFRLPENIGGALETRGGEIFNEFPVFSFLYGDPHAHIIGLLPVLMLLMALWAYIQQRNTWLLPIIGALLGLIFMTNVWDILVYAPLVAALLVFILTTTRGRHTLLLLGAFAFGLALILLPYLPHFTTGQSGSLKLWEYQRTPLAPFLLIWGGPLVVLLLWTFNRLKVMLTPDADFPVEIGMAFLLAIPVFIADAQSQVTVLLGLFILALLALAFWDVPHRYLHLSAAFFTTGLLTIDYVTVNDDRMNTGFKVSYQLWILAGLLMPLMLYRLIQTRRAFLQVGLALLVLAPTLLFAIKAIPARHEDSFTERFTLNGYDFMENIPIEGEIGIWLSASDDLGLIRYMRSHLQGYPVIMEAYLREYYWNSRISSFTGLPSVMAWQNHLRQQFPHQANEITQRTQDVFRFYATNNPEEIRQFISLYQIDYIVSGALEQSIAEGRHVIALEALVAEGLLTIVYQENSTRLYQVIR